MSFTPRATITSFTSSLLRRPLRWMAQHPLRVGMTLTLIFLILGHQIRWCPLHGDGAVYASLIKEASQTFSAPLHWSKNPEALPFYDHPYLFFFFAAPIVKIFGTSDIGIKIPNLLVGFLCLGLVFYLGYLGSQGYRILERRRRTHLRAGLLCLYFLLFTPEFEHQVRQPMLDPLAQLLGLLALWPLLVLFSKSWTQSLSNSSPFIPLYSLSRPLLPLVSGLFLGLAFLTKGLELLPNLGALSLLFLLFHFFLSKLRWRTVGLHFLLFLLGWILPLVVWGAWDLLWHQGSWFRGYYENQLAHRFLAASNFETRIFFWGFIKTLASHNQPGLLLSLVGTAWALRQKKKDLYPLMMYHWSYLLLTVLAFSLIKKTALQHLTGIYLSGALVQGQVGYCFFSTRGKVLQKKLLLWGRSFVYIVSFAMVPLTAGFLWTPYNKKDLWGAIVKAPQSDPLLRENPEVPVFVELETLEDAYGFVSTAGWYWPNPIYSSKEMPSLKLHLPSRVLWVKGQRESHFAISYKQTP